MFVFVFSVSISLIKPSFRCPVEGDDEFGLLGIMGLRRDFEIGGVGVLTRVSLLILLRLLLEELVLVPGLVGMTGFWVCVCADVCLGRLTGRCEWWRCIVETLDSDETLLLFTFLLLSPTPTLLPPPIPLPSSIGFFHCDLPVNRL